MIDQAWYRPLVNNSFYTVFIPRRRRFIRKNFLFSFYKHPPWLLLVHPATQEAGIPLAADYVVECVAEHAVGDFCRAVPGPLSLLSFRPKYSLRPLTIFFCRTNVVRWTRFCQIYSRFRARNITQFIIARGSVTLDQRSSLFSLLFWCTLGDLIWKFYISLLSFWNKVNFDEDPTSGRYSIMNSFTKTLRLNLSVQFKGFQGGSKKLSRKKVEERRFGRWCRVVGSMVADATKMYARRDQNVIKIPRKNVDR